MGLELGRPVAPGSFGENLTTRGIDLNAALLGEEWAVGSTRLRVEDVRTPATPSSAGWPSRVSTTAPGSSGSPTGAGPGSTCR